MAATAVKTRSQRVGLNFLETALVIVSIGYIFPILYLFVASMKKPIDIYIPLKFPNYWFFKNYISVFEKTHLFQALGNTVVICVGTLLVNILVSSMAGYIVGRYNHRLFQFLFYVFLSGFVIPLQTSMVPTLKLGMLLGISKTLPFLILLYASGSIPFAMMVYSGFIKTIPRELEEAASIDGAGRLRTFWYIIFPLLLPATGTIIVTSIFWYWNDFLGPLLYLDVNTQQTLITLIFKFKLDRTTDFGPIYAICMLATVPLIILFLFTQKYLIRGFVAGAVKG